MPAQEHPFFPQQRTDIHNAKKTDGPQYDHRIQSTDVTENCDAWATPNNRRIVCSRRDAILTLSRPHPRNRLEESEKHGIRHTDIHDTYPDAQGADPSAEKVPDPAPASSQDIPTRAPIDPHHPQRDDTSGRKTLPSTILPQTYPQGDCPGEMSGMTSITTATLRMW